MNWGSRWSLQTRVLITVVLISISVLTTTEWLATISAVRTIEKAIGKQTATAAERLAQEMKALSTDNFPIDYQNQVRDLLELEPNVVRVDIYADIDGRLKLIQSSSTRGERMILDQERKALFGGLPRPLPGRGRLEARSSQPVHFSSKMGERVSSLL